MTKELHLQKMKLGGITMDDSQFETLLAIEEDNSIALAKIADALEKIAKLIELG